MKRRPRLIALMNSYSQGKSGADIVFTQTVKRYHEYNKIIITSFLGKKLCQESSLKGRFLITTKESEFGDVILTYVKRILRGLFLKLEIKDKDLILATSDFLPDVLPAFYLKLKNRRARWVQKIYHLIPPSRPISYFTQKMSFFLIKRFADSIIVGSKLIKNDLVRLSFSSEKIFVNYPGIGLRRLKTVKANRNISYDGIFMAQLRSSKGIFDLPQIWKLVCAKKPGATLGIIGQGSGRIKNILKQKIKKEKLGGNIRILGYLQNDLAFSTIKSSKIFVFPSFEEGFGIAPLEAQALGLPIVAWDLPVFDEIFPKGMIKVKSGNIKDFAVNVQNLLQDKKLYQKLSKEARENAEDHDWDKVAEREVEIIQRLS